MGISPRSTREFNFYSCCIVIPSVKFPLSVLRACGKLFLKAVDKIFFSSLLFSFPVHVFVLTKQSIWSQFSPFVTACCKLTCRDGGWCINSDVSRLTQNWRQLKLVGTPMFDSGGRRWDLTFHVVLSFRSYVCHLCVYSLLKHRVVALLRKIRFPF